MIMATDDNELARRLKQEGVRVGEIIACRAWRVINPGWFRNGDDRLHSVYMRDYVWRPDEPASGDVQTHEIYSFRDAIRSKYEYTYQLKFGEPRREKRYASRQWRAIGQYATERCI